jgi:DNA-directed RNA polymerase subunit beta'
VREEDCETGRGIAVDGIAPDTAGRRAYLETRLDGRVLAEDVTLSDGSVLAAGQMLSVDDLAALRDDPAVSSVRARSVLTCEAQHGVCAKCYGRSLATGNEIELGEAVGVIAAQSIGEPGTQLTMRTFHTGGVAGSGGDIAGGLPRVVELFEARSPRGKAILARSGGVVRLSEDEGRGRTITVVADDGSEEHHVVPSPSRIEVSDGTEVHAGDPLVEGPRDPKELLEISGVRETQIYLVDQVQRVYRDQGVSIHDKHIELIVRQMTRRVAVQEPGDSTFLPGERVDARVYRDTNQSLVTESKVPAEGRPELMGITKASLATDSWLSAASFQETTRVLTEAAIESRSDSLLGLKENIIIGKLIPAGTGMGRYRSFEVEAPDYEPMQFWTSEDEGEDPAAWLASLGAETSGTDTQVTDLDDYRADDSA